MKKILLLFILTPLLSFTQSRTSTMDGNFLNPLIWNPIGIPTSGETVVINHNVVLNTSVYYTAGSITINAGGSLIEDATDRTFWADGTGSVENYGTFTTHLLAISPLASFINYGDFINIDSLWNQGTVTNTGTATLFDFWNDQSGNFINSGNLSNSDSLLNQGVFTNSGTANIYDFLNDQMATFSNDGDVWISNNSNNQGLFTNNLTIDIDNDFSNCNLQTMDAMLINNGTICVGNDFLNCLDDTLTGTNGNWHIGNLSSNLGVFDGNFTFHTPTGSMTIQGITGPGIMITTGACELALEENEMDYKVYPNPVSTILNTSISNVEFVIYDLAGKIVKSGMINNSIINMEDLNAGVYTLKIDGLQIKRIIKN